MKNIFLTILFSSLLFSINTQSIFILGSAEEESLTDKNILGFNIKAGINEDINSDINFKIDSEFYDENNYMKDKSIECTIPKTLGTEFGTKIKILCSINLYDIDCLKANKVKFIKIIKNENLSISDPKDKIVGSYLIFKKRLEEKEEEKEKKEEKEEKEEKKEKKEKEEIVKEEIETDYEFTAEEVKYIQYIGNQLIFLIKGQYNTIFAPKFDFELIINKNIKTKCNSPSLFLTREGNINCSLIIDPYNDDLISIKDGIEIKEKIYKIKLSYNDEKTLKFKIKEGDKLEFKIKKGQYEKEEKDEYEDKKSEYEIRREIERRKREKEIEEEKKKRDQEELENLLKRRQQIEKEQSNRNSYNQNDNNNNKNNNNIFNDQSNENEKIDYDSNVKLIHLQLRYSYDIIHYMFYALTPIPLGHKIKLGFIISTRGYDYGDNNKIKKNIVLKTEEEINPNGKNIIVEYIARFECPQCKKLILDKNNIYGAKIFNIPNEEYLLDAVNIHQMGNYLIKNNIQSPPLYITENIFNQNCMLELAGNFFNKNKFFISKFPLTLIGNGNGYYNSNKNVTVYCNLNEREIFSCPITDNLNNFEFKLEQFIVDTKENIIIDNSKMIRDRNYYQATCNTYNNYGRNNDNINQNQIGIIKSSTQMEMPDLIIKKRTNWKKIIIIIILLYVAYKIISKCFCQKEEDFQNDEYNNSRWRVSSSSYNGETYGLTNRGW